MTKYKLYEITEIEIMGQKFTLLKEVNTIYSRGFDTLDDAEEYAHSSLKYKLLVALPYINTH